jgi:Uncharacterised protein conserved in bacteria (DUF2336)
MAAAIRDAVGDVAITMQHETRAASRVYAVVARDANRRFKAHTVTEHNVHAPAAAQEFEKTVFALAKLGRFPIDLVERALLQESEEMVLLLAKASGCSWATARQLLLMQAAKRDMKPDDLFRSFERFDRLSVETARRVVQFHERRAKRRAEANAAKSRASKPEAQHLAASATQGSA